MKKSKSLPIILSLILISFTILTSCDVNSNDSNSSGTGHMSVKMTDAPATYDAVNIEVKSVLIKTDDDTTGNDGWVAINDDPVNVNLLDLRNGETITLGEKDFNVGTYHQIRFVLGDDNTVVINGQTKTLTTPSSQQSGLKLNIDANIEEGQTYNLLIDFDAAQSIVVTGSSKYILKPVLRAVDLSATGSITGNVQPSDFNTSVMATANDDTLSTITNDNGDFKIQGVASGTYKVFFDANSDEYADSTQTDIEVTAGDNTDLGTINLKSTTSAQ